MATDLFLEMAELPATGSLGTGQSDTCDLVVAGVRISISPKYLYLYLELSGYPISQLNVLHVLDSKTNAKTMSSHIKRQNNL